VGAAEALGGFQQYRLCDAVRIAVHVRVPEANYGPTFCLKIAGPALVTDGADMLAAIQLHHQLGLAAGQVGIERADRQLTGELRAITG
jgi:hypothetical protein